jgi:GAF domain-containing protein
LISERFGYYHTGIFLIDEDRRYAILRATNSEGGRKMLARGYKLRIGEAGIAGFVAQSGRPRLALDTSEDSAHFNNPNLPDTRSEVALPLRVGQVVIGVLDVQSTEPSAFDDEDLDILNTLANQVATVIQNARLFEQSRSALQGYSQAGHRLWREHIVKRTSGYAYRPDGTLASAPPESKQQLQNLIASGQTVVRNAAKAGTASTLAIPVKLRDQVIGVIHVESTDEKRIWSDDEIAIVQSISERAALALENARLFEEATHRAERERVMAQVTSHISESASFERILQTTLQELSHSLGATRTFIQLETPSSDEIETSPHQHAED